MSFPISPTNNQTTVLNGITYQYNSSNSSWTRVPGLVTATTNLIISGSTPATSTNTGALQVVGGVGIGGAVWIGTTSYIAGSQIITTATINSFVVSGVSSVYAGTDTAVNTNTGAITIWNTSTLQTITSRGSSTNQIITISNAGVSSSAVAGNALQVTAGGLGVASGIYSGGNINVAFGAYLSLGVNSLFNYSTLQLGGLSFIGSSVPTFNSQGTNGSGILALGNSLTTIPDSGIFTSTIAFNTIQGNKLISVLAGNSATYTTLATLQVSPTTISTSSLTVLTNLAILATGGIAINTATSATSTITGALTVQGGVGVGGSIYVGGNAIVNANISAPTSGSTLAIGISAPSQTGNTSVAHVAGGNFKIDSGKSYMWDGLYPSYISGTTGGAGTITVNASNNGTPVLFQSDGSLIIQTQTASTNTTSGALRVVGGVGIGGAVYIGQTSYISGAQILTTATLGNFGVSALYAGTDTAVSANTGSIYVWNTSTLQTITGRGNITNFGISITNTSSSTSTTTGALLVTGGVGIGGAVYIGQTSYISGAQILTTATLGNFGVSALYAGTDTAVSANTGSIYVWNTSTLQTITGRGNITNFGISITNTSSSTSTTTGALTVSGGVGIGGGIYAGGDMYLYGNVASPKYLTLSPNTVSGDISTQNVYIRLGNPFSGNPPAISGIQFSNYTGANNGLSYIQSNNGGALSGLELYVGAGSLWFGNQTSGPGGAGYIDSTGNWRVSKTTASTSTNTGALTVSGGVGIGGDVNVGGGLTVKNATIFQGPVTFSGSATYILSTNSFYTDNIIELHVPSGGVNGVWTTDDGKDIGLRFHYYQNSTDTNAALVLAGDSKYLEFYNTGAETTGSTFSSATYGTFKTGNIILANITTSTIAGPVTMSFTGTGSNATSTSTGALQVYGGHSVGQNLWVGGNSYLGANQTNYIQITGSSSGSAPTIAPAGGDPNIGISITTKNQGIIYIGQPSSTSTQQIQFNPGGGSGLYVNGNNTSVNYSRITGASTGNNPSWIARGGDNAVGLDIATFNTATINFFAGGDYNAGTGLKQLAISQTGLTIYTVTNSISTTTGALVVAGGVGVGGTLYVGGNVNGTIGAFVGATLSTTLVNYGVSGAQLVLDNAGPSFGQIGTFAYSTNTSIQYVPQGQQVWYQGWGGTSGSPSGVALTWSNSGTVTIPTVNAFTQSNSTNTGALTVAGGVGVGGAVYIGQTSYIAGAQILTTATFLTFNTGSVSSIIAGTDTSINSSTGVVTIWNTSTLQSITSRGSSTNYAISITNTASSTSTTTGALTVSGGIGVGGSVYVGGSTLQVGSGPTGLIIQPMVGGSYGAIYSTNIVPSTTNYTFITDGASPNFNGTNSVFFNVNNVNKLQVYPTYLNITPTTASTSTVTGALLVAGGVGVGGNVTVGGNIVLPPTGVATTSTVGYGSGVISLQNSVLFVGTSTTTTFNNGFTIQSLNSPSGNIYNSTLLIQNNNVYRGGGSDQTYIQFNGQNTQLSVINNNDYLGIQFMETYGTGYMGLINTNVLSNGLVPNNSYYLMFALSNTGTIGTILPRTTPGNPNFRNIIDDGAGSVLIGAGTNFTTTGSLRINHTTPSTSTTTGALVVSGSAGIGGGLFVGGNLNLSTATQIIGDFDNNTVNNRTIFTTRTPNANPGIYVVPNGTATAASWQAANNSSLTNASKILIATNGTTDVQLVSGINGTGTYLPLSFYNGGIQQMVLGTTGTLTINTGSLYVGGNVVTTGTTTILSTASSNSTLSNALTVPNGSVGVGQNVYVGNRVGWGSSTGTSVAYQFYNQATGSMDLVFG